MTGARSANGRMGFLLKIILFGVAVYAVWKTFARWKGLFDKFVGKPRRTCTARATPPPSRRARRRRRPGRARKVVIEDTRPVRRLRRLYFRQCGEMRPVRPSSRVHSQGRSPD